MNVKLNWRLSVKVGDLVSIKANIGLEDSEWGKAGLVAGIV